MQEKPITIGILRSELTRALNAEVPRIINDMVPGIIQREMPKYTGHLASQLSVRDLNISMNQQFAEVNEKFAEVDKKLVEVNEKLDNLTNRVTVTETKIDVVLEEAVTREEARNLVKQLKSNNLKLVDKQIFIN